MSVTSSIKGMDDYEIKALNEFLIQNIPTRDQLISNLGKKAFDTTYPIVVEPGTEHHSSAIAGMIGSLSELYIAVVAARYSEGKHNMKAIPDLVMSDLGDGPRLSSSHKDSRQRILDCLHLIGDFIKGEDILESDVIEALHILQKHGPCPFDNIGLFGKDNDAVYNYVFEKRLSPDIIDEIQQMGALFLKSFTETGFLKKDSTIVVTPQFGDWSKTLGAIGDLYIDGIIFDIKSRWKEGFRKDEIEQVYAYYLCSVLDKYYGVTFKNRKFQRKPSNMESEPVTGIGIYMSRFGEIVYCDIEQVGKALSPDSLETIACIIAGSKQDRINNHLAMLNTKDRVYDPISCGVYRKQLFKNIRLDRKIYQEASLAEYASYAYPAKVVSCYDVSEKEPIMWIGDEIPEIVGKKNLFYIVRFKASFKVKKGKEPFVKARSSLIYQNTINMETSDIYDPKTHRYYQSYRIDKRVEEALADITMTKEDFELFQQIYTIRKIVIVSGCYFI